MAKLSELQAALDPGCIVENEGGDEYVAAHKDRYPGQYVSVRSREFMVHPSFESLCEYLEPDAGAFTSEECHWEISPPPTPREVAYAVLLVPELRDHVSVQELLAEEE